MRKYGAFKDSPDTQETVLWANHKEVMATISQSLHSANLVTANLVLLPTICGLILCSYKNWMVSMTD